MKQNGIFVSNERQLLTTKLSALQRPKKFFEWSRCFVTRKFAIEVNVECNRERESDEKFSLHRLIDIRDNILQPQTTIKRASTRKKSLNLSFYHCAMPRTLPSVWNVISYSALRAPATLFLFLTSLQELIYSFIHVPTIVLRMLFVPFSSMLYLKTKPKQFFHPQTIPNKL